MKTISVLKNTVQDYAWGSLTAIPELLGQPATGIPRAELWMGAHPKAPSRVFRDGKWERLDRLIAARPVEILGKAAAEKFGPRLPYLFKVLAAARPLSIQAHPDARQAKDGFDRENRLGIALDSPHRNYRDASHKPECICALTRFQGMNGFRPIPEIIENMQRICPEVLGNETAMLRERPDSEGLKALFEILMTLPPEKRTAAVREGVSRTLSGGAGSDILFDWIQRLHKAYPEDIGVLFPALLNVFSLAPGQALYLDAGEPHAYLDGIGIEIMANSDNVIRGGLTPKHVDVPELMRVLTFRPRAISIIAPRRLSALERVYDTPAEEFRLSMISVIPHRCWVSPKGRSADILLCTEGHLFLEDDSSPDPIPMSKGESVIISALTDCYRISGEGSCYRASLPGPAGFVLDTNLPES